MTVHATHRSQSPDPAQEQLVEELLQRYNGRAWRQRWMFTRKKYAWFLFTGGALAMKRSIDILGALYGLLVFSPAFAAVALAIKLTDRGPVFYVAPRVGKWGREFPFPKFRSMLVNAEKLKEKLVEQNQHDDSRTFKMKADPRITWIGRIIRKYSIDELPQLWCVLVGDMSLVGPRPPIPAEVAQYSLSDRRRLGIKPGLTCLWQVSGRSEIPFPEQVKLDVAYIESQSLWLDLKILFKTIPAVLAGKGAY